MTRVINIVQCPVTTEQDFGNYRKLVVSSTREGNGDFPLEQQNCAVTNCSILASIVKYWQYTTDISADVMTFFQSLNNTGNEIYHRAEANVTICITDHLETTGKVHFTSVAYKSLSCHFLMGCGAQNSLDLRQILQLLLYCQKSCPCIASMTFRPVVQEPIDIR